MEFLIRPSNSLTLCQVEMHAPFERSNDPLKRLHQHGQCSYPPASEEPLFRQQAIIARERREERRREMEALEERSRRRESLYQQNLFDSGNVYVWFGMLEYS